MVPQASLIGTRTADGMTADQVQERILHALPGASVQVRSGDDVHFEARVIAVQFEGLRSVRRHQLVYAALGASVGDDIHALSLDTLTPGEWDALRRG